jgi:luciferase family oxidoreductase group 1
VSSTPISVLDLTPVPSGASAREALGNTRDLAQVAERCGYSRYWLAEHHNTPGMACPAPAVLIAHVAAATSRIRVGSGGVMLPNHSPLHVAETFRLLEALHPGRIDLGIGRAPGTDGVTAYALRRGAGGEDAATQVAELLAFANREFPADHPYASVAAEPREEALPPIWILGSSEYGAELAATLGCGFAFARHLNPRGAAGAIGRYRANFRPGLSDEPRVILTVSGICAETPERADELSWSMALGVIRMRQGRSGKLPSPEEAMAHQYTADEQDQVRRYRRAQVLGDGPAVAARLQELVEETHADELMVMTAVHDHTERRRSYELISEAMALTSPRSRAAA